MSNVNGALVFLMLCLIDIFQTFTKDLYYYDDEFFVLQIAFEICIANV